jgi:hypothetical protein
MIGTAVEHTSCLENTIGKNSYSVTMTVKLLPNKEFPEFKHVKYEGEDIPALKFRMQNAIDNGVKSALSYGKVFFVKGKLLV